MYYMNVFQCHKNLYINRNFQSIGVEVWNSLIVHPKHIHIFQLEKLDFTYSLFKYELSLKNLAE